MDNLGTTLPYRTYRVKVLTISGYSDDPWWREFYIDFEFGRLQFGSRPIGPTGDVPSGWMGDEPPPHRECADNLPEPSEGRPPTLPWQPSSSSSTDNIHVVVNQNRRTPEPVPPLRYYVSQHLNLLGSNPTISSGSHPHETPAREQVTRKELEVGGDQIKTPKNWELPDLVNDDGSMTSTSTATDANQPGWSLCPTSWTPHCTSAPSTREPGTMNKHRLAGVLQ